ncbi:PTPRH-like protein [Mya arenaria]|uniref:PTPRH-like protein n=1 Tax=Mya arenaria TaxID=6604 RepID=A0ABY7EGQ6_MYAAR|nr:PTPRH-like protein [Mya arenaria]
MWCLLRTMETVHYFALLVNLVSLTRSCHGLGQTCTVNPSNCTCTGEVCLGSNTCVCDSEHYTANGGCTEIAQLQVTSITFSQVDTTSMIVSWTPPSGKSGFIYDYKVQWRSNDNTIVGEPQAPPVVKPVVDIGKTSFNVSWSLIGPRPGQVTYTVILTADMGADSKKYNVTGYLNNSWIADGLEEYWNYTVSVKAITNVGCAKTSDITQKYRTLHSAPGAVTDFEAVKAEQRSDNFHKMTIRWKAPSLLERNSDIKEYVLKHNVGNIATNSGVGGELKTMSFTSETGDGFYSQEFDGCWPEKDYKLCFNPTIDKVNQFWTMIFEEAVYTIVMFAESKAHKKESRYWPSDFNEPTNYGHVDLEVTYLNTHNAYTHMKINICNRLTTRTVNHFQCAPVSTFSPDGFVYFVKCVRSNVKTGRILLQSSKGLASTVPFVVLDTCLQQLSDGALAEKVDVYKMLELFIFTHDCVQRLGTGDYEPLQNTAQIESVYQTLQVDD